MNLTSHRNGAFIPSSMLLFFPHKMKQKNMDQTIPNLHLTFWNRENHMKSKPSLYIRRGVMRRYYIRLDGKDILP